jgi:3-oxoacyl-[acyl-carrier-protein] synthase II
VTRRVVVTGLGAITPLGIGADTLFDRWSAGESGIADGVGRCPGLDLADSSDGVQEMDGADRFTQLVLIAAGEALAQAGWGEEPPVSAERVGCVIGTGVGAARTKAAGEAVARRHGLEGECFGTVSDCAGAHAIGAGLRMIQRGDADACVVGGSEAALASAPEAGCAGTATTSPSGIARPFDARHDGLVMGEGAGVLVLEEESVALERGAKPLAILAGYGATATLQQPDDAQARSDGEARAIRVALADAHREPDDVDYVNADGPSIPADDRSETQAIKDALGCHAQWIPVSSAKSAIGHLLGAAGAVEAVATVLAIEHRTAPPTVGFANPEDGLDLDYVPGVAHAIESNGRPPLAISNCFGFDGDNAVLCLEAAV